MESWSRPCRADGVGSSRPIRSLAVLRARPELSSPTSLEHEEALAVWSYVVVGDREDGPLVRSVEEDPRATAFAAGRMPPLGVTGYKPLFDLGLALGAQKRFVDSAIAVESRRR